MDARAVHHLARLARLELTAEEAERMAHDLTALLEDIAALRDWESSAGPPAAIPAGAETRSAAGPAGPDVLAVPVSFIAPEWVDGFFTVPRATPFAGGEERT